MITGLAYIPDNNANQADHSKLSFEFPRWRSMSAYLLRYIFSNVGRNVHRLRKYIHCCHQIYK